MPDEQRSDSGSFLGGFTLGIFAGAAGFFLFGTDKGRKLKEELVREWQHAQAELPDRGDGLMNIQSLRDVWGIIQNSIEQATADGKAKVAARPRKKSPEKVSKFKGT